MLWFSNKPKHLPLASGPFYPGCADIMLDYDKSGLFLRLFYPTNEKNNVNENCKKWIPWIPHFSYIIGKFYIPVLYGEKIRSEDNMKCFIVSHGLGGTRFLYSKMAIDLASHGFLVACLEHRDHSASYTYYFKSREDALVNKKTPIDFQHVPLGKNHLQKRLDQIKFRSAECEKTIQFFKNLNDGDVPENVLDVVEHLHDYKFSLADLVGKIDVNNFTLSGHSFGAATTLYTLPRRTEIKQSVLLDPWMFPIKNQNLPESIDIPLIFINTQTFHIETNISSMAKFLTNKNTKMYTIRKSTHENQTDTVLISRYWLNFFMRKIDPFKALNLNDALILKFLHDHINYPLNVEKYQIYLDENRVDLEEGLTKPWQN